jgi:hypothetical protein
MAQITSRNSVLFDTPQDYLQAVLNHSPVLKGLMARFGHLSLKDYLELLEAHGPQHGCQDRSDLLESVYQYALGLLGPSMATRAANELSLNPVVLTANHHGVDFFSHSFQASLMLSLYRFGLSKDRTTVPVFSCAGIPLNNATYPQGMLFYGVQDDNLARLPLRLPIFPDRLKRRLVSNAPAYDHEMVARAQKRLVAMAKDGLLHPRAAEAAGVLLKSDFADPCVLGLPSYSDQAVVLNNRVWKRLFRSCAPVPDLVFLELEKIVTPLVVRDLGNHESLLHRLLFEAPLREALLQELDGVRTCWELDRLKRITLFRPLPAEETGCAKKSGTLYFWGLTEAGKRIPLFLVASKDAGIAAFKGFDDQNNLFEISFTPKDIISGIRRGRLIPSLFTSYFILSIARGVRLIGSYFQGEYLPRIQRATIDVLRRVAHEEALADMVEKSEANFYLAGMLPVMVRLEKSFLVPAGPVELIAAGGLTAEDLDKVLSVQLQSAHIASLVETIPDFLPQNIQSSEWKRRLIQASHRELEGAVLIKDL